MRHPNDASQRGTTYRVTNEVNKPTYTRPGYIQLESVDGAGAG